ncbi:ABC transporter ATP-binding protein [Kurthia sibirica]|uniref:Multidrug ABC transporter ATP-binding protein n=1 Tax=Kurthia sibirica TaxID=202750 RepID=A0A2U3AJL4_9BACL|nr:ABC transporter ATP-binding protein [Kurthia sibirica]PWI24651.1 multidrug ABC transporter ATP-binding protein [Kurthia sibirica]GEK33483.1 ABC transporter ATP-binding protein [Kurthia sibirica]
MTILEVTNVTGGYTRKPVIHNLNFKLEAGELVGLVGLNGAGKSTAIKHIIGMMQPQEGIIKINGKTMKEDMDMYRTSFSYIPETPVLYDELTLKEHLELTAMAFGIELPTMRARVQPLLEEFRMEKRLNWFPSHFSKGMRQKVMVMCAFLVKPSLYIIDEPFLGLDPLAISVLLEQMDEQKKKGSAILMSTHVLATAEKHCDKILLLHNGKVRAFGTMDDLRQAFNMPEATLDDLYIAMTKEEEHE